MPTDDHRFCFEESDCSETDATCICDMFEVYHESECKACAVENCILCEIGNPFLCDVCDLEHELNINSTECLPYDCFVEGCSLCNRTDPFFCEECLLGFEEVGDGSC